MSEDYLEPYGGLIIDYRTLSPEALEGLIEGFVTQEGTDYGELEFTLAEKVAQVKSQLITKEAMIVFDAETETTNIIKA